VKYSNILKIQYHTRISGSSRLIYSYYYITAEWWGANENCTVPDNSTSHLFVGLDRCLPHHNITENCTYIETPATQFWERYVLNITTGLGDPGDLGGFNYPLPLALMLSWIVVFLCLMKGVQSSGKVLQLHHA
jgi:hypothetical protein